jgi:hypothetical protein
MQEYLAGTAKAWPLDTAGRFGACFYPSHPQPNVFYGLDANAMLAFTHAVEETALEEAEGSLLVSFQDLRYFDAHRERYWQLAATIQEVCVLGAGRKPRPEKGVLFRMVGHTVLRDFWIVLREGRRGQVLLVGRQTNRTEFIPSKKFLSYYTFNPTLIGRMRANINAILAGGCLRLYEFDRLRAIDQAARWLDDGFRREQAAAARAIGRLRRDSSLDGPRRITAHVDSARRRLGRLKDRIAHLFLSHDD